MFRSKFSLLVRRELAIFVIQCAHHLTEEISSCFWHVSSWKRKVHETDHEPHDDNSDLEALSSCNAEEKWADKCEAALQKGLRTTALDLSLSPSSKGKHHTHCKLCKTFHAPTVACVIAKHISSPNFLSKQNKTKHCKVGVHTRECEGMFYGERNTRWRQLEMASHDGQGDINLPLYECSHTLSTFSLTITLCGQRLHFFSCLKYSNCFQGVNRSSTLIPVTQYS